MKLSIVFIIVTSTLGIYLSILKSENNALQLDLTHVRQRLSENELVIQRLQSDSRAATLAQNELYESLKKNNAIRLGQETKIQGLINENAELKKWANTSLPDDIISIMQRPEIKTYPDYELIMSIDNPVHAVRNQTSNQH